MSRVSRKAIVPYTCAQMYELVTDVGAYDRFLPWCRSATVKVLPDDRVRARLEIRHSGLDLSLTTVNRNTPAQSVEMEGAGGSFRWLRGRWDFTPLGDGGCKVALVVDFEFAASLHKILLGQLFKRVIASLMNAFLARAEVVYGRDRD